MPERLGLIASPERECCSPATPAVYGKGLFGPLGFDSHTRKAGMAFNVRDYYWDMNVPGDPGLREIRSARMSPRCACLQHRPEACSHWRLR